MERGSPPSFYSQIPDPTKITACQASLATKNSVWGPVSLAFFSKHSQIPNPRYLRSGIFYYETQPPDTYGGKGAHGGGAPAKKEG